MFSRRDEGDVASSFSPVWVEPRSIGTRLYRREGIMTLTIILPAFWVRLARRLLLSLVSDGKIPKVSPEGCVFPPLSLSLSTRRRDL